LRTIDSYHKNSSKHVQTSGLSAGQCRSKPWRECACLRFLPAVVKSVSKHDT